MNIALAKCKDAPNELFYREQGNTKGVVVTIEQYCKNCPIRLECLQEAMENSYGSHDFGIWGGTTPRQRRLLRVKFAGRTCACETGVTCHVHVK